MPRIFYHFANRTVEARPGETILQASLRSGIPHTHACGGEARCSTCRVVILDGLEHCAARNPKEQAMADRLHFAAEMRLACQTTIRGDIRLRRLVLDADDVLITDQRAAGAVPDIAGEEKTLAIMFVDVRGFTAFAETLPAYDVVHALNRIFCALGPAITRHGGRIDNYMGDGLMALFDGDDPNAAALHAVNAGLDMLEAMAGLQAYFQDNYGQALRIGIGLHCGEVVIGSIGAVGSKRTTAIGDAVNLASRIEAANKPLATRFLISGHVHDMVGEAVLTKRCEDVSLPGKAGTHTLYEVIGLRPGTADPRRA